MGPVESQLREDLADAMRESPLVPANKDSGNFLNIQETNSRSFIKLAFYQ
jgi:hypothetical protein